MGKGLKITLGAVAALIVFGACSAAIGGNEAPPPPVTSVAVPQVEAPVAPAQDPAPAPAPAPEPELPPGVANAIRSAQSYLDIAGFSRSGLIEQLEYEGFTTDEATTAVDSLAVDFNAEAAESAANYLDVSSFSRSGLLDQLEYEGFTPEQAEYGVSQAYDS